MEGPSSLIFNYSDCRPIYKNHPILWWMADKYKNPTLFYKAHYSSDLIEAYGENRIEINRHEALHLFWLPKEYSMPGSYFNPSLLSRDKKYARVEVASFRSDWTSNAFFVAFKGGTPRVAHGTMDVGSFVLDALGERWITMLPHENYSLPSFWSGKKEKSPRWKYYRNRAEGNNTLIIGPSLAGEQKVKSVAKFIKWQADIPKKQNSQKGFVAETSPTAALDLTPTYAHKGAVKVHRTFTLPQRKKLILTDNIKLSDTAPSKEAWWFAHILRSTKVQFDASKRTITLEKNGKRLTLKLIAPSEARFTLMDATKLSTSPPTHPKERSNVDYKKIAIHLLDVTNTKIIVEFSVGKL